MGTKSIYNRRRVIRFASLGQKVELDVMEASVGDLDGAYDLIRRTHYQQGKPRGRMLVARIVDGNVAKRLFATLEMKLPPDPTMAGVAVIGPGCTRGKPAGRQHLARAHFASLDLERLPRDIIVSRMKLAMIQRVAVEPAYQGNGIGSVLALECRRYARFLCPPAEFVEVITTRRIHEAEAIIHGGGGGDFLQRAGFVVAPSYTGRQERRLSRLSHNREVSVRLYYWAKAL